MLAGELISLTAVPNNGAVFKFVIGHALPLMSATQAVFPSGVIAMPTGVLIPLTAVPNAGEVFKLLIGHALPPVLSATQAVVPSGVIAMPWGPLAVMPETLDP